MKNPTIVSFAVLLVTLLSFPSVNCYADNEPIVITIADNSSLGGYTGHHIPVLIPIQATYFPTFTTIMVDFCCDCGLTMVEIVNLDTGSLSLTTINATEGVHPFIISGAEGAYEIVFTLSNGRIYTGSFEICY